MLGIIFAFIGGMAVGVALHCMAIDNKKREEFERDIIRKNHMD